MDECHTVLDSQPDFRPKMKAAGALMIKRGVQMIYLTATLRPADQEEFFSIVKAQDVKIIRGPTTRPNIRYSVFEHDVDVEEITAIRDLVEQKLQEYPAPAKIIIYGSKIETIEEIGRELGYHVYQAKVGSGREKEHIQQRWGSGDGRVIVWPATHLG